MKNILTYLGLFSVTFLVTFGLLVFSSATKVHKVEKNVSPKPQWNLMSIDTMKYSRDMARDKLNDSSFDAVIDKQISDITKTGANYVAIDTPYDEEFRPILKRWVAAARKHNLHVWFRGNFSGWEQWFGYSKIDPKTHLYLTQGFIINNPELFEDGDVFTSCSECENGAKIDTSNKAAVSQYRQFLIEEYQTTKDSFSKIHKNVASNYFSMNKDIADAIMDPQTVQALDGIIVIDHYVATPDKLADDVRLLAEKTGAKIVLGEFGAPIPDINGTMTDSQQTAWLQSSLEKLSQIPQLDGVNYWVNVGSSTALWNADETPKPAVAILKKYYSINKQ